FIGAMKSVGTKPRTNAAVWDRRPSVSNRSMVEAAVRPPASSALNASTPVAPGAMTPIPVIATRVMAPRHPEPRRRRRISRYDAFSHLEILRSAQDDGATTSRPPEQERYVAAAEAE